jgi:hypothetical protein
MGSRRVANAPGGERDRTLAVYAVYRAAAVAALATLGGTAGAQGGHTHMLPEHGPGQHTIGEQDMSDIHDQGETLPETSAETPASNPMKGQAPSSTGTPADASHKTRRPSATKGSAGKGKAATQKRGSGKSGHH